MLEKNSFLKTIKPFMRYKGVSLFQVRTSPENTGFFFSILPGIADDDKDVVVDIRKEPGYDPEENVYHNLVRLLNAGSFGELADTEGDEYGFHKMLGHDSRCPVCGHAHLVYGTLEIMNDSIRYPWQCTVCGVCGNEWGKIKFDGHTYK